VEVGELRLPPGAVLSLLLRNGELTVPTGRTVLRAGDLALVATDRVHHDQIDARLRAVSRSGRLARWYAPADRVGNS
jgi:cell volume regulation protein A